MATTSYAWVRATDPFFMNNLVTSGRQEFAAIAGMEKGGYFSAWGVRSADFIQARMVRDNGAPSGDEFGATSTTANDQQAPALAALANGRVVMVFDDDSEDPGGDIRARLFNRDGAPLGQDFAVTTGDNVDFFPDVAALADGGFAVSWSRLFGDDDYDVRAAVFNADGSVRTPLVVVADDSETIALGSSMAGLADGSFVVAWTEGPIAGTSPAVRFQRYDANGVALEATSTLLFDEFPSSAVEVLALRDGGFAIAFGFSPPSGGGNIALSIYDADGSSRTAFLPVGPAAGGQSAPTLTQLSNGFIVAGFALAGALHYQVFLPSGQSLGEGELIAAGDLGAEIAALSGGLVASVSESLVSDDGGSNSIRSQIDELVRTTTGDGTNETLDGDDLADHMLGGGGKDRLTGAGGKDSLEGGAGDDVLRGGLGRDLLIGGAGADRFAYADVSHSRPGAGADLVKGFEPGLDLIDVSGIDARAGTAGDQAFVFGTGAFTGEGQIRAVQSGADTIVRFNVSGPGGAEMEILLKNVDAGDIDAGDFVL